LLFPEDATVEVGKVIAILATEGEDTDSPTTQDQVQVETDPIVSKAETTTPAPVPQSTSEVIREALPSNSSRFYSPLVRNIAKVEGVTMEELNAITGTGAKGRVTKRDILGYVKSRIEQPATAPKAAESLVKSSTQQEKTAQEQQPDSVTPVFKGNTEIIEMDRMRKLIAGHMVKSKQTSPHVTSFVEADVTQIVHWRNKIKDEFVAKNGYKITFTPIFIDAVVRALKDHPMINVSVEGDNIIVKKDINIGMAVALPSGNLIVPVLKNADDLNMTGLARKVDELTHKARQNKLAADDIQGGTFTLTNVGTFGNLMGTPIINQPEAAIMATGAIKKKPVVMETELGDVIAIRHMMFLSLSYDHRVVDGFLGGTFLRTVADYLENFDPTLAL
jgi:2-oxoglutarate dehydrogenase E2 component (dihydrolipoamide succinyltransferase)